MDSAYAALLGALIGGFFSAAAVVAGACIVQWGEARRLRRHLAMQIALEHYNRFCRDLDDPPSRGTIAAPGMLDVFYGHALKALALCDRGGTSDLDYLRAGEELRRHYSEIVTKAWDEKAKAKNSGEH